MTIWDESKGIRRHDETGLHALDREMFANIHSKEHNHLKVCVEAVQDQRYDQFYQLDSDKRSSSYRPVHRFEHDIRFYLNE